MGMTNLLVSVVIPCYNRGPLIRRAIDSALTAMSPGDEIILVDDASTDDTKDVLSQYGSRIRYWNVPHGGAGAARNFGVVQARNPLVAFLDDDDEWMPDKLQLQRGVMQARPEAVFCFSEFIVRDHLGHERGNNVPRLYRGPRPFEEVLGPGVPFSSMAPLPAGRPDFQVHVADYYEAMLDAPFVLTTTVVVRRDAVGDALRFAEDLPTHEDWVCYARVARAGPGAFLACATGVQHKHGGQRVTDLDDLRTSATTIAVLQRVWGADPEFMAHGAERVQKALAKQRRVRAGALVRQGRMREARDELRLAGSTSLLPRLMARLPAPVARGLTGLRDALRGR